MVYDDCCAGDCGVLAQSPAEWLQALNFLTRNPERRQQMVARAQRKLRDEYGPERLLEQVWAVVRQSEELLVARKGASTFVD